ncbi:hypothetical protein ACF06P_08685 [Streptomyces sp. NPDC015684]|uniref:hypothetical protein n=1 Tax=Streptomyces sp. NPDC015684 TaxID=3364963 RepID=UPI0036F6CDA3
MTDSPIEEPDAGAAHPSTPVAGEEDPQKKATVSPAVEKARAMARSRADKAHSAFKASYLRDLWIGGAIFLLCFIPGFYILFSWFVSGVTSSKIRLYHGASWGWGLGLLIAGVLSPVTVAIRRANGRAAFEAVLMSGEFSVRMAELDSANEGNAPLVANRALLEEYHRLSTSQAKSAFQLAQWVMGASALLVSAGAVAVGLAPKTATAVTLASLTAFVTALSGYISSTLLATYRVSVEQARFYFREPLAGGYLLAAEHLADRLGDPERAAALGRVVDGFIQAGTSVPGAQQDPAPQDAPPGPPPA